ncbi:hypothetical protein MD535_23675 [Vibrio sp. ZSDZ65]|uniref:Uncharacterized protein n=1 Tax=Vibrio qingdaonensis TaxID=2829491 RepID=A0A9X3HYX0_9VIBR|nr:hypothetical protein [Vibrio qingdaonensis]MCW8348996.1 hypothetical protein [Vibrio qingdaonensis]
MTKIKKRIVDEFYNDIPDVAIGAFRNKRIPLSEMIESGFGAHLIQEQRSQGASYQNARAYSDTIFSIGRYMQDRNNIFVSADVLKIINKAKLDNMPDARVQLPFKSFKLRFPVESKLQSALVTVSRNSVEGYFRHSLGDSEPKIIVSSMNKNGFRCHSSPMDKISQALDNELLSPVIKFCVLYSTGQISMDSGHPLPTKYSKPKKGGKNWSFGFRKHEFDTEIFVRPHFRNLRDERYYKKPPYDEWDIGSRWTFVTGSTKNAKSFSAL